MRTTNTKKNFYAKSVFLLSIIGALFLPCVSLAAPSNFKEFLGIFTNLFELVIPLLITVAVIGFMWGVTRTIFSADDAQKRIEGRKIMIFGIFALFSIVAIWGIIKAVQSTFF